MENTGYVLTVSDTLEYSVHEQQESRRSTEKKTQGGAETGPVVTETARQTTNSWAENAVTTWSHGRTHTGQTRSRDAQLGRAAVQ